MSVLEWWKNVWRARRLHVKRKEAWSWRILNFFINVFLGNCIQFANFSPAPPVLIESCIHSSPLILSSTSVRIVLHLIINHLANHALRSWRSFTELIHKIVLTNFNVMGIEDNLTILVWWWISFKSELLLNFRISFSCNSHYKMKSKGCTTHLSKLWMKWHDSGGPHICSMVRSGCLYFWNCSGGGQYPVCCCSSGLWFGSRFMFIVSFLFFSFL